MEESEKKTKRRRSKKKPKPPKNEWKFINRNQTSYHYNPHELVAEFNCTEDDRNLEHITANPKFNMEYPCPVYVSETRPNKTDPCHKRVAEHFRYNRLVSFNQAIYNSDKKRKDIKHLMKKENTYPSSILRIAELLESIPDPYFKGEYDWYFTGGNLEIINERNLVFHIDGDNLNEIVASKIVHNGNDLSLNPKVINILTKGTSKKNLEIFEIKKIQTSPKLLISIRQKYSISLYQYRNEKMKCTLTFTQKKVPFISSANDFHQTEYFVSSDLEKTVLLWDINNSTSEPVQTLFKSNNSVKNENWNCIRYFSPNIFALAEFDRFSLLDRRVPFNENNHIFGSLKDGTEYCEKISAINVSNNYENLLYFGTTHKVFAVDVRYLQKEFNDKYMLIKWTHQLNASPLIIKSFKQENDYEIIIASSPISGDVRLLENFKKDDTDTKFLSPCLPYMPPSLLDGFNQARNKGKCLNPIANLKKRIDHSITGMNFYSTRDGQLYTLTSNSIGDVFSQQFLFKDGIENLLDKNLRIMNQWEKDVLNMEKSINCPLNVTNVENFIGIKKVFRCNRLGTTTTTTSTQQDSEEEIDAEPKRPQRLQKWQKPIGELKMYKDALANDILEIWDINDDLEEDKDNIKIETKIEKEKKMKRIEEWLKTEPLTSSLPPSLPLTLASPSMVQISHTSYLDVTQQNSSYGMLDAASIKSENLNHSQTEVTTEVKEVKKVTRRSRYVQGF